MKILLLTSFCFLFSCKGDDKIPLSNTWVIRSLKINDKEVKNIYTDTFVFWIDSSLKNKCTMNEFWGLCKLPQITPKDSNTGKWRDFEDSIDHENNYTIIISSNKLSGRYKQFIFKDEKIKHYTLHMVSDSFDIWCIGL